MNLKLVSSSRENSCHDNRLRDPFQIFYWLPNKTPANHLYLFAGISLAGFGTEAPLTSAGRFWLKKCNRKNIINKKEGRSSIIDADKDQDSFSIFMDFPNWLGEYD